ncbi:MAG TPA: hypothetical protein VHN78_16170, partial [Chloroflexota bacterium]|nr:hypothetical protein [Chloroflexota bacterium]
NDLMTSRMRQFERVVSAELPALCEDFRLDQEARDTLQRYARQLQDWMAGILNWHEGCRRYVEAELQAHPVGGSPVGGSPVGGRRLFGLPVGLGTSAARLSSRGAAVPVQAADAAQVLGR